MFILRGWANDDELEDEAKLQIEALFTQVGAEPEMVTSELMIVVESTEVTMKPKGGKKRGRFMKRGSCSGVERMNSTK